MKNDSKFTNLHINGRMKAWWKDEYDIAVISWVTYNNMPIGACIILRSLDNFIYEGVSTSTNVGVYVKSIYRRKGIGTELLNKARKRFVTDLVYWNKATYFFKSEKIRQRSLDKPG